MSRPSSRIRNHQAFPIAYEHEEATCEMHGMSMRQYYKAAALTGWMANYESGDMVHFVGPNHLAAVAKLCGDLADAMLDEDRDHE